MERGVRERQLSLFFLPLISAFSKLFMSLKMNHVCYQQKSHLIMCRDLSVCVSETDGHIWVAFPPLCHSLYRCLSVTHTLQHVDHKLTNAFRTSNLWSLISLTRSTLAHNNLLSTLLSLFLHCPLNHPFLVAPLSVNMLGVFFCCH